MLDDLKDLIENMFSSDPENRPTIREVIDHPWMQGKKQKLVSNES